jgi:putative phage-type endonuclease
VKDRAAWLERRKQGLGASDAPIVAGVSPYRSPFELWQEKRGEAPAQDGTPQMARGNRLEPVAADWYAEVTGRKVRRVNQTVTDPHWPHLFAHPDRRSGKRNVQIKTGYRRWEEPPQYVQVQVQHEMGLMRAEVTDVVLMTFDDLHVYEVPRDDLLIRELFELEEAWWERHVVGGEPPADGSKAYSQYLDRLPGEAAMVATEEQEIAVQQLYDVREVIREAEDDHAQIVNWLKESMVGSVALEGESFSVSWKPYQRTITDWKTLALDLRRILDLLRPSVGFRDVLTPEQIRAAQLDLDALQSAHSNTTTVRPFVPHLKGNGL